MNMERKTLHLDVKFLDEAGAFTGLLSVYDVIDEYGDAIEAGAYTKTLHESGGRLPLLWQHNQDMPIGTLEVEDGAEGLQVKGRLLIHDDVPQAKTAYALLKAGVIRGLSIGFRTIRKKMEGKIRKLKEIKLYEGSLVTIPANPLALVDAVKSVDGESKDFSSCLEMVRMMDSHYQIMTALRCALSEVTYSQKLISDEKVDAAAEVIDQFRGEFMAYLPKYLSMQEEHEGMGMMSAAAMLERLNGAPDAVRDALTEFSKGFLAQFEHPGTSKDAASAAEEDENKANDLEALQSLLTGAENALRSELAAPQAA